ncbi:MAG TPA: RNA polymerase sigma-70 factor [Chitinophagaceae bacterium]|nr:RNA polymerase sigma-70 factor [Chitinophagaceae bacterium]
MNLPEEIDIPSLQQRVGLQRDEQAYKFLFLYFHPHLLRFAFSMVKNEDAAEEIVSDVMMRLWSARERLVEIENLKVYLFTSVKNTALNYLSRNAKYTSWDLEYIEIELDMNLYNPEEAMLQKELISTITSAIKELPPKCQMAYKLVREDGFSYKEVASIMGISENTVDRHINTALHKLTNAVRLYVQQ